MSHRVHLSVLSLAIGVALALAGCGDSSSSSGDQGSSSPAATSASAVQLGPQFGSMDKLPGILKTAPPWSSNRGKLQLRLRAIGLPVLGAEGQVVHIHQHLDIVVNGKPVQLPADVGIGPGLSFFSPLHTHDPTGIMHVESATAANFSLGQFFAVWGVNLTATCIGGECASGAKQLHAWVDGKPVTGDPTRIVLADHQVIVLAFGTKAELPTPVPATYDFPADL
jgi:hypothetical protein